MLRGRINADENGRPAPAPLGTGLTAVSATPPLILNLVGSVLTGSVDLTALGARTAVQKGGVDVGTRGKLNLVEGVGAAITAVDNPGADRVDVTVAAAGVSGLTAGRVPVAAAADALEDSRIVQTSPTAIQVRVRETADDDWNGLQVTSDGAALTTIAATQADHGLDTSPGLLLSAGGISGGGSATLGSGGVSVVAQSLLGQSGVAADGISVALKVRTSEKVVEAADTGTDPALGFFGATPVVQPPVAAGGTPVEKADRLGSALDSLGLIDLSGADPDLPLPVADGGTGAATQAAALLNLGGHPLHGVPRNAAGGYDFTMSYNSGTRVLTLTPTGTSFDIWTLGTKRTFTGAQTFPAHANATNGYFLYVAEDGTLTAGTTLWDLRRVAPIAYVFYNATLGIGIPFEERHTATRDPEWHIRTHSVDGTQLVSGLAPAGYTLQTDTLAGVTYSVGSGVIADEDVQTTVAALADGGPYAIFWRTGASGVWGWTTTDTVPFKNNGTNLQWNQFTGGAWQLTAAANGNYINYWLFAVPAFAAPYQIILVPGQAAHASLSAAQAESVGSISWGTIPFQEIAPIAKITMRTQAAYSAASFKSRIEALDRIFGSKATITAASPGAHGALSGRSDVGSHPASAITFAPTGTIAATTVQAAIEEVASEAGGGGGGASPADKLFLAATLGGF